MVKDKSIIKKLALLSVVSFSAISFASATFAWFVTNKQLHGGGATVTNKQFDIVCEFDIYQYDQDTLIGTDVYKTYDAEGSQEKKLNIADGTFKMLPYDTIFINRNKYTPAVVRIGITGPSISKTTGRVNIQIGRDTSISAGGEELAPYFTSAINFQFSTGNGNIRARSSVENMFSDAINFFKGDSAPEAYNFVTNDNGTWTKSDSLTLSLDYTVADWQIVDDKETLYTFLFMDYDPSRVTEFSSTTITTEGLNGNTIELNNDLTNFVVTYENA